jgi:hypothetical protein
VQNARLFVLVDADVRQRCVDYLARVPEGFEVLVSPPRMNDGQRDRFHAICSDLARSGLEWAGAQRNATEWKALLISGHAVATHQDGEVVTGLEGELVPIRESTTSMSKRRGSSLIEYSQAYCMNNGVRLRDPRRLPAPRSTGAG